MSSVGKRQRKQGREGFDCDGCGFPLSNDDVNTVSCLRNRYTWISARAVRVRVNLLADVPGRFFS